MHPVKLYNKNAFDIMDSMASDSVDCVISDPLYDETKDFMTALYRICRGNIILFCKPEHQFFIPDEWAFWCKPPSPKANTKNLSRNVEIILIAKRGNKVFNGEGLYWRNRVNWWDDVLIEPQFHEFQKPLSLIERLVRIYSNEGDIVFDPFMGSGTTAEACIRSNRGFAGCEINSLDFSYCEQRLMQYHGNPESIR